MVLWFLIIRTVRVFSFHYSSIYGGSHYTDGTGFEWSVQRIFYCCIGNLTVRGSRNLTVVCQRPVSTASAETEAKAETEAEAEADQPTYLPTNLPTNWPTNQPTNHSWIPSAWIKNWIASNKPATKPSTHADNQSACALVIPSLPSIKQKWWIYICLVNNWTTDWVSKCHSPCKKY